MFFVRTLALAVSAGLLAGCAVGWIIIVMATAIKPI